MVSHLKKESDLSRLMSYAGRHKAFTYASWVLSAVSALMALVPFLYIWMILRDVLNAAPDYSKAVNIPYYGWMAVLFAVLSYLVYVLALLCSHTSAFRVATNLRLAVTEHLAKLPLGFTERYGSGRLRKVIQESTGAAETYLAHQLPDQYGAMATPIGVLLFVFDWRLGLLSLIPVFLGFAIMSAMTGKRMAEKMRQYGNALAAMSNEAVEYVRGIPVVKTFGQSVFSFKKFKATIDEYEKWVVAYTMELRMPMMFYTAAINGVFAFLIAGGLLFTKSGGKSTLASLMCRFFDVQSGSISIGCADVREIPKEELMDTVSFVFQNSRLIKGSILDNVKLGRPEAAEEKVLAALKAAQCMDIIEKFPDGIHTVIGSKGVYLSGGEQQRIAIARAMLKNAPVLILDEATAFADPDNEAKVQAAFAELAKGKTVIMIAHRLSTVVNADCIYVVRDGQIEEAGTKDELCAKDGLFSKMWRDYQSSVEWKVAKEG